MLNNCKLLDFILGFCQAAMIIGFVAIIAGVIAGIVWLAKWVIGL